MRYSGFDHFPVSVRLLALALAQVRLIGRFWSGPRSCSSVECRGQRGHPLAAPAHLAMPLQLAKLTAITQQAIRLSLAMFAIKDDAAFSHVRAADFSNVFVADSYADVAGTPTLPLTL